MKKIVSTLSFSDAKNCFISNWTAFVLACAGHKFNFFFTFSYIFCTIIGCSVQHPKNKILAAPVMTENFMKHLKINNFEMKIFWENEANESLQQWRIWRKKVPFPVKSKINLLEQSSTIKFQVFIWSQSLKYSTQSYSWITLYCSRIH